MELRVLVGRPPLVLRPARAGDAPLLARWWAEGELMAWVGFPQGLETDPENLARRLEAQGPDEALWILEAADMAVGEASHRIDGSEAQVGLKVWSPEHRGRGWGRIALGRLVDQLWTDPRIGSVVLDTWEHNLPARRSYEALGFVDHGPLPPWTDQTGHPRVARLYSLPRPPHS